MKAISVKQPWANLIASGEKTIETRSWRVHYRGDLLICSSKVPNIEPAGMALAIVRLVMIHTFLLADEEKACVDWDPYKYAWILEDLRPIQEPFPVRGYPGIFNVELPNEYKTEAE